MHEAANMPLFWIRQPDDKKPAQEGQYDDHQDKAGDGPPCWQAGYAQASIVYQFHNMSTLHSAMSIDMPPPWLWLIVGEMVLVAGGWVLDGVEGSARQVVPGESVPVQTRRTGEMTRDK